MAHHSPVDMAGTNIMDSDAPDRDHYCRHYPYIILQNIEVTGNIDNIKTIKGNGAYTSLPFIDRRKQQMLFDEFL